MHTVHRPTCSEARQTLAGLEDRQLADLRQLAQTDCDLTSILRCQAPVRSDPPPASLLLRLLQQIADTEMQLAAAAAKYRAMHVVVHAQVTA